MKKNILITGGLGFIGTELSQSLIQHGGYKVRILDNLSPQVHGIIPSINTHLAHSKDIEIICGDVCKLSSISEALKGIDVIIHMAAETGTAQSMYQVAHYNTVNSQATAQMLDVLANSPHQVKKVILASSRSIYGEGAYNCSSHGLVYPETRTVLQLKSQRWDPTCPMCGGIIALSATREDAMPNPASIYAATKYAQEDLIKISGKALNIDTTVLRFQNVYGAGQSLNNPYTGILSIFSTRIRLGMSLPIFEDGAESRDFVHVKDVARAICQAIENDMSNNETFNVGAGEPTSVLEIADMLVDAFGGKIRPTVTGEYRLGDIRHCYADLSKIKSKLNFEPVIPLKKGIEEFANWVLSQPLPKDGLEAANKELKERKMMS